MIFPRLRLARKLLSQDGMIFISIDDNEQASLRALCDEVFGRENFVECFIWKKSYGGGPKEKYAVTQHEYVLMYARSLQDLAPFSLPYDPRKVERYYKGQDEHFNLRGPYRLKPLEATKSMDARPNLVYDVALENGELVKPQRQWLWSKDRVLEALKNNHAVVVRNGEKTTLNYKQYLKDEDGVERGEKPFSVIDGIYTQHGTDDLSRLFPTAVVVQFPKPVALVRQLIQIAISNDPAAIVLDFFAGSATTAEAFLLCLWLFEIKSSSSWFRRRSRPQKGRLHVEPGSILLPKFLKSEYGARGPRSWKQMPRKTGIWTWASAY
ncbi:Type III restrictionmodification system methylation subunit EC 21172 [Bradyrhizobium sp.]|nr:Type III restrictionmodification system methylation subunit EC 21172 [Bradyrhizobium sp.]